MKERLLLIESDKYLRYQIARGLRRRGFKVKTAKNCETAVLSLHQESPAVILAGLGDTNDIQPATELVNSIPKANRPPVILLGLEPGHSAAQVIQPDAQLDIPYELNQLRDVILKIMETKDKSWKNQ